MGRANESARIRKNFDFGWKFENKDIPEAFSPSFDDRQWQCVRLPHDWSIRGAFMRDWPAGGSGAYLPTGIGWYRKPFKVDSAARGKKVFLAFDGVYMNCDVFLNGVKLGSHSFGYTGFTFDLTPYLRYGDENLLAVRVDNSEQPNSRWYSGSGIYRHVWLDVTDFIHVAYDGLFLTTPSVSGGEAEIGIEAKIVNETGAPCETVVTATLFDENNHAVASIAGCVNIEGTAVWRQCMTVAHPRLWSPESPALYRMNVSVGRDGKAADTVETAYGIRTAVFDEEKGLLLNGRQVKMKGVCLHQDGGCVGAAVPEKVWERRLLSLRTMGCNAIRASHNPPSVEFLDLCDRIGFLVMDEAFDEWTVSKEKCKAPSEASAKYGYSRYFEGHSEEDLLSMLRRDRNHPSIVLWSVGNEIPEQSDPKGHLLLRRLVAVCHDEDPYRSVTSACDKIAAQPDEVTDEFLAGLDVVGYNYVDRWGWRTETFYADDRRKYPHIRMIGSENRSVPGIRGNVPDSTYLRSLILAEKLWKFTAMHGYVAGDFIWTGIDYLGETTWPEKNRSSGPIDTCGFAKDAYYFYQSIWTDKPMLHLFPHWNREGREGEVLPVFCFTNCDSAELFVNGKSFGEKCSEFPVQSMTERYDHYDRSLLPATTSDLHLAWDVPYEPGVLKAVGKKDGRVVCEEEVCTTGKASRIALSSDSEWIAADARDLFHLTTAVTDENGRTVPTADNGVTFRVEGPGELIGVDNGDPQSHEPFFCDTRKTFNGLCLAVIRSAGDSGEIRVTAESQGLRSASLSVSARRISTERETD